MRLMLAPRWVQGLVYGLLFGVSTTMFYRVWEGRWLGAVIAGVLGGAFYGVFMAMTMSSIYQRMLAGWADGLSLPELQTVLRAAGRGPVPADPRLREAALTAVQRRHTEYLRTRSLGIALFSVFTLLSLGLAFTQSWWWLLATAAFLGFLILSLTSPRRLQQRLSVLADGR